MASWTLPPKQVLPRLTGGDGCEEDLADLRRRSGDIQDCGSKVQRPNQATSLRRKPEFLHGRLPDNGDLSLDEAGSLRLAEALDTVQSGGRRKHADPLSIDEDAGTFEEVFNCESANRLELWHGLNEFQDDTGI